MPSFLNSEPHPSTSCRAHHLYYRLFVHKACLHACFVSSTSCHAHPQQNIRLKRNGTNKEALMDLARIVCFKTSLNVSAARALAQRAVEADAKSADALCMAAQVEHYGARNLTLAKHLYVTFTSPLPVSRVSYACHTRFHTPLITPRACVVRASAPIISRLELLSGPLLLFRPHLSHSCTCPSCICARLGLSLRAKTSGTRVQDNDSDQTSIILTRYFSS